MRLRWILISYFLIGGGVALALGLLALAWIQAGTVNPHAIIEILSVAARDGTEVGDLGFSIENVEFAMVLVYGAGAALGGFFTGRASPHRSYLEPAIAAALVVGSFLFVVYSTPMGKILVAFSGDHLERLASLLAAAGIALGMVGAILGELASTAPPKSGPIRRTGIAILIMGGALWTSVILFGLVFANEVAEKTLENYGNPNSNAFVEISQARILIFAGLASASAAAAGGAAAQLAAPTRALFPAAVAGFGVFASACLPLVKLPMLGPKETIALAIAAGFGGALVSTLAAWLISLVIPHSN